MTISYALISECQHAPQTSLSLTTLGSSPLTIHVISETSRQRTLRSIVEQKIIPKWINSSEEMMDTCTTLQHSRLVPTHDMFTFYIEREENNLNSKFQKEI
ncbi:hypothetical protein FDP41_013407 [Naegleria fowleri]|uniref:Uncharacterized protein n=1 Tax=Naegleria fowleri TaxID=5763 RepID=A0A6A5C010_NAEFO|nr:uncharacterized protein FDP41_013761 [Naegleria fowleri]XP_044564906.1 uncharacterized protein FDP41_013407 [Naegleria fowleri]KAF0980112.1 hypothetical protein FDP41_013761 [Naegleria fowleri]KAF0980193.1 hypothetical protein FDP41_013407 [Naegleria fowleri]